MCQRFQVVPPCGGHQVSAVHLTASFFVSSRAPVWGASGSEWYNFKFDCVSSRAPVWGASRFLPDCMISTWFQVVPPCGGHPQRLQELEAAGLVSSRAPVWGASFPSSPFRLPKSVSSRAPVWGASRHTRDFCLFGAVSSRAPVWGASQPVSQNPRCSMVSSRAPVWGASDERDRWALSAGVSSRAPVWGASTVPVLVHLGEYVSSRAPVWGASDPPVPARPRSEFQVVPPCGGHLSHGARPSARAGFKSCPRVGGIRGAAAA